METPLLSICLITYNHEQYIEHAIESVLMQKTNFPWELVIADDCSTDGTTKIIQEYQETYPERIKLILQEKNIGPANNWMHLLTFPKSKYVAYLDGDDFWTDPFKLQKQVDVLENNPALMGCFHNSEERFYKNYSKASTLYVPFKGEREITTLDLTGYNMVPSASIVFKNQLPAEFTSDKFLNIPVGDWPFHLLMSRNGNYYYLPQIMSVRRLNANSTWGMQDQIRNTEKMIGIYQTLVDSGWFDLEVTDLLKSGRDKLRGKLNDEKVKIKPGLKERIVNHLISVLKKI